MFKIYVKIKFNNIWQLKEHLRLNYPKIGGGKATCHLRYYFF
ncbi:hypothetical protein HMPREF1860_02253 [Prevotella amnii]|uniref:Uncharacterized protein n=1 Tax=Prevotella amnii TaxID=419005 RepID=A0A134B2V8_9BACT|nr:hypothetical protein HMPREF1860_02253 [Prevotella amnii]